MYGSAPFGTAPFGAGPLADGPVDLITEGLTFGTAITDLTIAQLMEALELGADPQAVLISVLAERMRLTGSPLGRMDLHTQLTEGVAFEHALASGWQVMLEAGIEFTADAVGTPIKFATIVDTLHLTGQVTTRLDALAIVATVLAINTLTATGWKAEAMDTLEFQDALASQLNALGRVLENVGFGAEVTSGIRVTAVLSEQLALGDDVSTTMELLAALREEVLFYTTIRLGDEEYSGWVLNGGAPTEYRNYPFNGMATALGSAFGTSSSGLYELTGTTDAGEPIEGFLRTALMDFGTGKLKRVPDIYLAFAGGNKIALKVIVIDEDGEQHEHIYVQDVRPGKMIHTDRLKVGRGLKVMAWQYEIANVDGAPLEIDTLQFRPLVLDRRIG